MPRSDAHRLKVALLIERQGGASSAFGYPPNRSLFQLASFPDPKAALASEVEGLVRLDPIRFGRHFAALRPSNPRPRRNSDVCGLLPLWGTCLLVRSAVLPYKKTDVLQRYALRAILSL